MERMVVRGRENDGAERGEEDEETELEGLNKGAVEEIGGGADEAGVEMGELRLDEEGEDLHVPLAWVAVRDWVWFGLRLSD